jgi:hypothetical protein
MKWSRLKEEKPEAAQRPGARDAPICYRRRLRRGSRDQRGALGEAGLRRALRKPSKKSSEGEDTCPAIHRPSSDREGVPSCRSAVLGSDTLKTAPIGEVSVDPFTQRDAGVRRFCRHRPVPRRWVDEPAMRVGRARARHHPTAARRPS